MPKADHSLIEPRAAARMTGLVLTLGFLFGEQLYAQGAEDLSPHSEAQLVAEVRAIAPGEPFTAALRLVMDEGWHSYWVNPGDAGTPASIEWSLPRGFEVGPIQWPYPERIEVPPLMSYGYFNEVLLLVEITPPADLALDMPVALEAGAYWLVCSDICLPAEQQLRLVLPVAEAAEPDDRWTGSFTATRDRLPVSVEGWDIRAERTSTGYRLSIIPLGEETAWEGDPYYFPRDEAVVSPSAPQAVSRRGSHLLLSLQESSYSSGPATRLEGVLLAPQGEAWDKDGRVRALAVDVAVTEPAGGDALQAGSGTGNLTLAVALVFALIGGSLLNLMPCVFPVLSIKVLGFVNQAGEDRFKAGAHGVAFAIGVVLSFLALAGVILLLRSGGSRLGWGFQLQSPAFVAAVAILLFALALNLMGLFEVGTVLTRLGGRVAQPQSYVDSLSSGVLATLIATPCTAPFMGTALGFALTQPMLQTLLVFGALGLGMAIPYVVVSASPALLRLLPKPGAWMETTRQLLAFPLFGTVIWLVWVFARQTGVNGAAHLLTALMMLAFATWVLGRWKAQLIDARTRLVSRAVVLVALGLAVGLAARGTRAEAAAAGSTQWQPFSQELVQQLRAAGQPVFIDFTAAWCLSCQVNEQVVLASRVIEDAFVEHNVATLKADWTRFDPVITSALESFGRSGVPLYVFYPADLARSPVVLPTILTKRGVLDVLQDVASSDLQAPAAAAITR
ncbi:MAG: thioredoxin family protein [Gemmatimonadota bacterium]|nr:MAG: thioredoxin family protein [Gemmatimonadota bacterium]